jgi:hypothetical protein
MGRWWGGRWLFGIFRSRRFLPCYIDFNKFGIYDGDILRARQAGRLKNQKRLACNIN